MSFSIGSPARTIRWMKFWMPLPVCRRSELGDGKIAVLDVLDMRSFDPMADFRGVSVPFDTDEPALKVRAGLSEEGPRLFQPRADGR